MKFQIALPLIPLLLLSLLSPLGTAPLAADAARVGEGCGSDADCSAGLHCDGCDSSKVCTRIRPVDPQSMGKGLPFNRYSWLTTHNSFARQGATSDTGTLLLAPVNQADTVTSQLKNGVRGLMLDMYDFMNDIWLCHSFGGKCYNFTAFQPALKVLKEIDTFLEANPSEVVTIFIEDYVTSPQGLSKVFNAAGLSKFLFPVTEMPKNGSDWPLLSEMISKNQRLLVFTSKSAKEASEGIAYEWNYVVENQYGSQGMLAGSCLNRSESAPMNTKSKSLVLMNYFETNPNQTGVCGDNGAPLLSMLNTCYDSSGKRWPNYIAVDFYMKSNGAGAPQAADVANGHLVCGCDNIAYCKANATFGTCEVPPPAPDTAPSSSSTSRGGASSNSSPALSIRRSFLWLFEMAAVAMLVLL